MSILLVNMSIDRQTGGGTAARTLELAKSLNDDFSAKCIILTTDQGLDDQTKRFYKESNNIILPCLNDRFYIPIFSWRKLKNIISKVETIHIMSHWTLINVLVYFLAMRLNKPYTFCPAGTLHIFGRSSILKKIYNYTIGSKIIKNASKCIAITELERSDFVNFGVDISTIEVISNGIDKNDLYPNQEYKNSFIERFGLINSPYILFMGRLNLIKGPDILLDAFIKLSKKCPEFHLVFAGPNEGLQRQLQQKIKANSLENRVHLIGYIDKQMKIGAYTGASLLAVPSRREAMSIVAIEAGACETPVIVSSECGFDEVQEVGCSVVEPVVEEFYKGLYNMIVHQNLEVIGKNFHDFVEERYTWKKTASKYLEL
jgi:glycosyltransferase involved in cell wall biosynthesis